MRISDWSSDVFSSDLSRDASPPRSRPTMEIIDARHHQGHALPAHEGGRALCRPFSTHAREAPHLWHRPRLSQGRWPRPLRSEEHTSELQSLMRISYAVFCLKKKKKINNYHTSPKIAQQ